ncbi:MAG: signal peptidase I [Patescibacteria group bacterium]
MENDTLIIPQGGAPKKKHRVMRAVVNVIVYILIIASITVGIPKFLSWYLDTPYPMATITSGSMWPALKEGDLVFIKGIRDRAQVQIGDVIVYRNRENNTFTIHRVVALGNDEITTQGDANFTKDAPVKYEDVVGETFKVYGKSIRLPSVGFVTMYASSKVNLQQ